MISVRPIRATPCNILAISLSKKTCLELSAEEASGRAGTLPGRAGRNGTWKESHQIKCWRAGDSACPPPVHAAAGGERGKVLSIRQKVGRGLATPQPAGKLGPQPGVLTYVAAGVGCVVTPPRTPEPPPCRVRKKLGSSCSDPHPAYTAKICS